MQITILLLADTTIHTTILYFAFIIGLDIAYNVCILHLQVTAVDRDPIQNGGKVTYTFVSAPGEMLKFQIDADSGEIFTKHVSSL